MFLWYLENFEKFFFGRLLFDVHIVERRQLCKLLVFCNLSIPLKPPAINLNIFKQ